MVGRDKDQQICCISELCVRICVCLCVCQIEIERQYDRVRKREPKKDSERGGRE